MLFMMILGLPLNLVCHHRSTGHLSLQPRPLPMAFIVHLNCRYVVKGEGFIVLAGDYENLVCKSVLRARVWSS